MPRSLISSYARIKPLGKGYSDQDGGTRSGKRITGWDEEKGEISINKEVYNHLKATLPPEASQKHCYEVICKPLVNKWLEGYDVDLLSYGQTGSGKTYTMFGPPFSMEKAAKNLGSGGQTISPDGVLKEEHGFTLRSGFDALQVLSTLNSKPNTRAVLHGSMVEMSIMSLTDQSVQDLLNNRKTCFVDKSHHLQGAKLIPLENARDIVNMAAAVESRLTRGTKMNDTSSRSHCVTVYTLSVLENNAMRQSRLQFFDLMGSERFKGGNAAHDSSKSSKSSMGGWEGIYANLSLSSLTSAVEQAAKQRHPGNGKNRKKMANPMMEFCLTELLNGSLVGNALTAMVTCVSQHPRNGDETYLSTKYGASMSKLPNFGKEQPWKPIEPILRNAKKEYASIHKIVQRGVNGKYQALREAQLIQWANTLDLLNKLVGNNCDSSDDGKKNEKRKIKHK
eukprot:g6135.t1